MKNFILDTFILLGGSICWKDSAEPVCWRLRNDGRHYINSKAGVIYRYRALWCLTHGELPVSIDHIDGDPSNDFIENLRCADQSQQNANRKAYKNNKLGAKGVSYWPSRGVYRAEITWRGKRYRLGYFATADEASMAYTKAAKELHKEFAAEAS